MLPHSQNWLQLPVQIYLALILPMSTWLRHNASADLLFMLNSRAAMDTVRALKHRLKCLACGFCHLWRQRLIEWIICGHVELPLANSGLQVIGWFPVVHAFFF